MARTELRPAPLATGTGLGFGSSSAASTVSENTAPTDLGQGVTSLQSFRLQKRFGLSDAVAKLLSSHAFGDHDDHLGDWISLADVTVAAFENHVGLRGQP